MRGLAAVETRLRYSAVQLLASLIGLGAVLGLALALLHNHLSPGWSGWIQVVAGASLCLVAGWFGATISSRSYWNRSMARQVAIWRRITDAYFAWVEDLQVSTEALNQLKVSLEEAVPSETV
jgi:hypothetical protein